MTINYSSMSRQTEMMTALYIYCAISHCTIGVLLWSAATEASEANRFFKFSVAFILSPFWPALWIAKILIAVVWRMENIKSETGGNP